jgi:hypothetical protein
MIIQPEVTVSGVTYPAGMLVMEAHKFYRVAGGGVRRRAFRPTIASRWGAGPYT